MSALNPANFDTTAPVATLLVAVAVAAEAFYRGPDVDGFTDRRLREALNALRAHVGQEPIDDGERFQ